MYNINFIKEGTKIWFGSEKRPYRVKACNERFAICTKPFNIKKTVLYTICDWGNGIRGTENLVFGASFETYEECVEALERLTTGETEISKRNYVNLDITMLQNDIN